MAPRIYVGTRDSEVFAILDPERDGIADEVVTVASGLKVPNGLALAPDGALLIAEQHRIIRLDGQGRATIVVPRGRAARPAATTAGATPASAPTAGSTSRSARPATSARSAASRARSSGCGRTATSSRSSPAASATRSASTGTR